jgi:Family of unknown function (DUF6092)
MRVVEADQPCANPGRCGGGRGEQILVSMDNAADRLVLSETAAVEVLAYLVCAARTQLDEAAEYAPLRLITAASRLADGLRTRASAPVQSLIAAIESVPATATPRTDRDAYIATIDQVCLAVADCLLALNGTEITS